VRTLDTVKKLQRGDILIKTESRVYAEKLMEMTSLANVPVNVSPHRSLNCCKGVIWCRDVACCDKEEIIDNLRSHDITDAVIITVKMAVSAV